MVINSVRKHMPSKYCCKQPLPDVEQLNVLANVRLHAGPAVEVFNCKTLKSSILGGCFLQHCTGGGIAHFQNIFDQFI